MAALISYHRRNIFLTVISAVAMMTAVAWAVDEGQQKSKSPEVVSLSNITHNGDDRLRFIPDNLFSVDFIDAAQGWAAGYYGTILKTTDGGESWSHISLPNTDLIRRIQFLDTDRGWLVTHRGRIMSSKDGGATWTIRHTADSQVNLRNIEFLNADIGWAVGHEGTILHTNDGGETWANQSLSNFTGRDLPRLNGLTVLSESRALLAGEFGVLAETIDAGMTWTIISEPDQNATYTEIEQVGSTILAVGLNGVVARVQDADTDTSIVSAEVDPSRVVLLKTEVSQHFFDIVANKTGDGIIVGLANILTIRNGSELSKVAISRPDREYLYFMGAAPVSETKYVLVGARGLAVSLDSATSEISGLVKW